MDDKQFFKIECRRLLQTSGALPMVMLGALMGDFDIMNKIVEKIEEVTGIKDHGVTAEDIIADSGMLDKEFSPEDTREYLCKRHDVELRTFKDADIDLKEYYTKQIEDYSSEDYDADIHAVKLHPATAVELLTEFANEA